MARGRKPRTDPTVPKKIYLLQSTVDAVDEKLTDPFFGNIPYNAWGQYIERLIKADLEKEDD